MALTQDGRLLSITTPLGKDVLLLETLEGAEEISGLFRLNLVLLSDKPSLGFADLVGQRVTINIQLANNQTRSINGFVSRFSQGGFSDGLAHYYA